MKFQFIILFVLLFLSSCRNGAKEKELQSKETALNQREQELLVRENALQLREDEIANRERLLDTTNTSVADTLNALHPTLTGTWNVTMRCTETTCTGSAVGDTKKEQWQISLVNNSIIAKAINNNAIVRVYTGSYIGNTFELTAQQENADAAQAAKITVRLQKNKDDQLSGQREIMRPENCRILYSLELQKQ